MEEGRENLRTNCIAWHKALWFEEGFTALSIWERKMSTPIIEELGKWYKKKKKRENGMNSKVYFTWFKLFPKTCPMEMTVTCSPFCNSGVHTLGKTISLVWFVLKMISLVTVIFCVTLNNFGTFAAISFTIFLKYFF